MHMDKPSITQFQQPIFSFLKGNDDVVAPKETGIFDWDHAARIVRENLSDAMNAKNIAFMLGSGCSSLQVKDLQVGIPTMKPMADTFISTIGTTDDEHFLTDDERDQLNTYLGIDITQEEYTENLERLMEVLYSFKFVIERSSKNELKDALRPVQSAITKLTRYILHTCTSGEFANGNEAVFELYSSFYRRLIYRDRVLPRPWVFTTNYDLFNEVAMDRLGIPYSNGFSGTVERRFNPATFRYSLAEQFDISSRKWNAVDNFVYLCKLHGSVNWIEEEQGLFPIRELQEAPTFGERHVLIFPTPAKQNASFASPYSDLFREFQARIVREQSVLFVLGYGFGDEHVNNVIFRALTIPTFRLIAFVPPNADGIIAQLRSLDDPRIWLIGGDGPTEGRIAHHFDTIIEKFMPEAPDDKVDKAITKALQNLLLQTSNNDVEGGDSDN